MVYTNLCKFYEKLFDKTFLEALPVKKTNIKIHNTILNKKEKYLTDCAREASKKKDFKNK
jgi:hypothetical protein